MVTRLAHFDVLCFGANASRGETFRGITRIHHVNDIAANIVIAQNRGCTSKT